MALEKYKLKKAARQFFDEKMHDDIRDLSYWKKEGIPMQLLEEVPIVYIDYGHENFKAGELTRTDLCELDYNKKLGQFKFTLKIQDMTGPAYDKINIAKLMDEMQAVTDKFFKNHINAVS